VRRGRYMSLGIERPILEKPARIANTAKAITTRVMRTRAVLERLRRMRRDLGPLAFPSKRWNG